MTPTTRVLTTGQVARVFSVNINTVIKWFDDGKLEGFRLPQSSERRIYRESVIEFMRKNEISTDLLRVFDEEEFIRRKNRRSSRPPASKQAMDLRVFPRKGVSLAAVLTTVAGEKVTVQVLNISMGGAFIGGISASDGMVPVEFGLTIESGDGGRALETRCQMVHLQRLEDGLGIGCRFTQVDPSRVQAFLTSL